MRSFKVKALLLCILMITLAYLAGTVSEKWEAQTVIISEVRNDYGTILYDASGDYHGYIELFNPTNKAI